MPRAIAMLCLPVLLFGCTVMTPKLFAQASGEELQVGVAEVDITPPVGFPMAGYYHERLATGSRDPLKAKAMVFRQGETKAAFVVADLTGIARDLCEAVRRKVSTQTAIPPKHIVVSATHSHTAPDYTGRLYEFLVDEGAADSTDAYPQMLIDGIVTAVVRANERSGL